MLWMLMAGKEYTSLGRDPVSNVGPVSGNVWDADMVDLGRIKAM